MAKNPMKQTKRSMKSKRSKSRSKSRSRKSKSRSRSKSVSGKHRVSFKTKHGRVSFMAKN